MQSNLFYDVSQWLWPLMDLCVLIIALTRFRARYWGRLLAVSAGISLTASVFWRVVNLFSLTRESPSFFENANQTVSVISLLGMIIGVIALASIPGRSRTTAGSSLPTPTGPSGEPRSAWLLVLLLPVTLNIYWLFWLHRTVRELRDYVPGAIPFTPGRAVGYMFIPFFNFYWVFRVFVILTRTIARLNAAIPEPAEHSAYAWGMILVLLPLAWSFNMASSLNYHFLLLGESLLILVFAYTQRYLNRLWRSAAPVPASSVPMPVPIAV